MGLISRVSSRTYRNEINLPNQTFSSPIMARYRVICEPRGFLTILQIIFSLTTIIVLASVAQKISVNLNCKPLSAGTPVDREIIVIVKYPFQFGDIQYESCASNKTLTAEQFGLSYSSQSQFFMSSLAIIFIYSILRLVYYIFKEVDMLYGRFPAVNTDYWATIGLSVYNFIAVICCVVVVVGLQ